MRTLSGNFYRFFLIILIALTLPSCATVSGKFSATLKENVGIFADQTVAMLSEADLGFNRSETVYVREFIDIEGEEVKRLTEARNEARMFFRNIIKYSFELVIIAETRETEADKITHYADYIAGFDDSILEKLEFDKEHYSELIEEIRAKEKFLDALKAAQPIINSAGQYMNRVLDEVGEATDALEIKLDRDIDMEYADIIRYQEALEEEKYAILGALEELYLTIKGDEKAFERLVKSGAIRRSKLIPEGKPSEEDIHNIGEHLLKRLEVLHKVYSEVKPDWEDYRATHRELDTLHGKSIEQVSRARVITLVWVRAHQKMASGVLTAAEWFDVKDLIHLGTKAIF